MKIQPTSRYIRDQVAASGEVILLLGVRRDESATRAGSVARYDNGARLNRHNDLPGCMVYRPSHLADRLAGSGAVRRHPARSPSLGRDRGADEQIGSATTASVPAARGW
jgi:hypothetical protein